MRGRARSVGPGLVLAGRSYVTARSKGYRRFGPSADEALGILI